MLSLVAAAIAGRSRRFCHQSPLPLHTRRNSSPVEGSKLPSLNESFQYLAVAAHPSDSPFHKIGSALSGPGFVQIWFLLSLISKQDSFSSSHTARLKRRPDGRKSAREDTNDNVSISSTIGKAGGDGLNGIQGNVGGLAVNTIADETESLSAQKLGLIHAKKKRKLKDQARTGSSCADALSPSVHLGDSKSPLHGDSSPSIDALKELALPKIVLCLVHDGRVALDVKWQPCSKQGNRCRMGFLAVVLGDGSIQVWEIPTPRIIKALFVSGHIKDTDPRFMKLKPVFKCSKLLRGDSQSIPLTLEWSRAVPNDLLLVGCHDGTIQDLCFVSQQTRFLSEPYLGHRMKVMDANCENLVATAGHSGNIRFWDIRDPFRPLWDIHLSRGFILSMDWVHNPSSVIFSMDDGTLRILSLLKAASDVPVTGRPFSGKPCQGLQTYYCSSHAVWSVQVSQVTGMVAYCSADGSVLHFQLTSRGVEKDKRRHRTPHYLSGSLTEDTDALTLSIPKMGTASPMKRVLDESGKIPRPLRVSLSDLTHAITANPLSSAGYLVEDAVPDSVDELPLVAQKNAKSRVSRSSQNKRKGTGAMDSVDDDDGQNLQMVVTGLKESPIAAEVFPPKIVSMNRVRWNPNRGSEKWLCYGGAAGIIRCQEISMRILER
ncbi:hypothetical protein EJ110_NYTH48179 [Nymphaea thermarum]|nr:hypothetical protein EJ110_NYTH48179 [Nymphaea thermarum]